MGDLEHRRLKRFLHDGLKESATRPSLPVANIKSKMIHSPSGLDIDRRHRLTIQGLGDIQDVLSCDRYGSMIVPSFAVMRDD